MIDPEKTFLIADTHFGHKGIIEMCNRPFQNMRAMNRYMIRRWNECVKEDDLVFFLGDMAFGKKAKAASTYMKSLNGEIILIRGNHDKPSDSIGYQIIDCGNYKFLLCHYPEREELPLPWEGWIIHGHKHNNDLKQYPFINGERKTINVSVEVINYKPLKMSYLLSLELFGIKYLETVNHHAINW